MSDEVLKAPYEEINIERRVLITLSSFKTATFYQGDYIDEAEIVDKIQKAVREELKEIIDDINFHIDGIDVINKNNLVPNKYDKIKV